MGLLGIQQSWLQLIHQILAAAKSLKKKLLLHLVLHSRWQRQCSPTEQISESHSSVSLVFHTEWVGRKKDPLSWGKGRLYSTSFTTHTRKRFTSLALVWYPRTTWNSRFLYLIIIIFKYRFAGFRFSQIGSLEKATLTYHHLIYLVSK